MPNLVLLVSIKQKFVHQADFAAAANLDETTLSRILMGRRQPTAEQKRKMAEILEISENELFANS